MSKFRISPGLVVLTVLLAGCNRSGSQNREVRFATLPILDSLPLYVAEAEGLFAKRNLNFRLVPVASGLERDQLMQAGQTDGMLNEISSTLLFNQQAVRLKMLCLAREARPGEPLFRVLVAPGGEVPPGPGTTIGISENTVIEYVTVRLLAGTQREATDYPLQNVPSIPERYQLLMEGALGAATLPDPLAFAAITAGAGNWLEDASYPGLSLSLLSFSADFISEHPALVDDFYACWQEAVSLLNSRPEKYRGLLLEHVRVPPAVQASFPIPTYPEHKLPTREQWEDTADWLRDKGILEQTPNFQQALHQPAA